MVSSELWSGGRTLHSLIKFWHVLGANSLCKSMTMSPTLSSSSTKCQYTKYKVKIPLMVKCNAIASSKANVLERSQIHHQPGSEFLFVDPNWFA